VHMSAAGHGPEVDASNHIALLTELQARLKPAGGGRLPKLELLAAAVALARDPGLTPAAACKENNVPAGGARTRVLEFRDRILREGLLSAPENLSPKPEPPLVTPSWIKQHTPSLEDLETHKMNLSLDGCHVIRTICCRNTLTEELLELDVHYDMPPTNGESAKQQHYRPRRAMHRQREEATLRSLDVVAAAKHQFKRAKLRHEQRHDQNAVAAAVERLIASVERKAMREQKRWFCPGGCHTATQDCTRAQFRLQCMPAWICEEVDEDAEANGITPDELRADFILTQDGIVEPELHWEPELSL